MTAKICDVFGPAPSGAAPFELRVHGRSIGGRRAGAGATVVLLPPLPWTAARLDALVLGLSGHATALAVDPPGFGRSAPLADARPSVQDLAADVLAVLDHLEVDRAELVGAQLGALTALAVAVAAPDRVGTLVVRDLPVLEPAEREALSVRRRAVVPRLDGGHVREHLDRRRGELLGDAAGHAGRADPRDPAVVAGLQQDVVAQLAAGPALAAAWHALLHADARALVAGLPCELHLLVTPADLLPPASDRLAAVPGGLRVVVADDEPAALRRILRPAGRSPRPVPPSTGTLRREMVSTRHGRLLVRRSNGRGTPLVCLHAAPGSGRRLEPLLRELAGGRAVLGPDALGVGGSDRPEILARPRVEDYAEVVLEALDALGVERLDLYGAHTGALVALEVAVRAGDRVGGVVLDGVPLFSPEERETFLARQFIDLEPRWDGGELLAAWAHVRDAHRWFPWFDRRPGAYAPRPGAEDPGALQRALVDLLETGPGYVHPYRAAFLHPTWERLAALRAPTLVCRAPGDPLARHAEEAAGRCAATCVTVPATGPAALARVVGAFLDAIPTGAGVGRTSHGRHGRLVASSSGHGAASCHRPRDLEKHMGPIETLLREFYDAWDSGDAALFERVVRKNFADDAVIVRPEETPVPVSEVLPLWLVEIEAWKPQTHDMQNVIEAGDICVAEYKWTATHNSLLKTTDGREFPPTGKVVSNHAVGLIRAKDGRIVEATALYSGYQEIVRQLEADRETATA